MSGYARREFNQPSWWLERALVMDKLPLVASPPAVPQRKKNYHAPELVSYGDIREITQTIVGGTGMNDTVHGNDKTAA